MKSSMAGPKILSNPEFRSQRAGSYIFSLLHTRKRVPVPGICVVSKRSPECLRFPFHPASHPPVLFPSSHPPSLLSRISPLFPSCHPLLSHIWKLPWASGVCPSLQQVYFIGGLWGLPQPPASVCPYPRFLVPTFIDFSWASECCPMLPPSFSSTPCLGCSSPPHAFGIRRASCVVLTSI